MFGRRKNLIILMFVVVIGVLLHIAANWVAEYLWFQSLGFESVFLKIRALKIALFVAASAVAFAYFWINFRIFCSLADLDNLIKAIIMAQMHRQGTAPLPYSSGVYGTTNVRLIAQIVLISALTLVALSFGNYFHNRWDVVLRFWFSQPFATIDPLFGHDIGFYLFVLPVFELLQNSLNIASLIVLLMLVFGYNIAGQLPADWRRILEVRANIFWHLACNVSIFVLAVAWGFYLDRYDLLQSTRGVVHGAGFTDAKVVLPAIWIMIVITLAMLPILLVARVRRSRILLPAIGWYFASYFFLMVIVPIAAQSFLVEPNELERETPYLIYNIDHTRSAYDLDHVENRSYGAFHELNISAFSRNRETIDNIRVWDWRPLSETFRQLQQIRTYYAFGDVDVDRYPIGGAKRQVMLAARELSDRLPENADTWVNRRLQYTHGYGLAMSIAAEKREEGDPVLAIKDLPPQAMEGLSVVRPAIYFGENLPGYVIAPTSVPEFDYPEGDRNVYTRYSGQGGVEIGPYWKRLLFAWFKFDANIAITSYATPDSRIQLWRNADERIGRIAPFLRLDADPYLVVNDGLLYWIQDAYTVSSNYPYSEPYKFGFNYIRNSVKAVINAYDGDVTFYVIDRDDPILAVYRAALPELFANLDDMPDGLRRHLRYPQDLFEAQVAKFGKYHMTVPQVFYNSEDLWSIPKEKYGGEIINMRPYYILVRLPGEAELQFLLMTPLTPANRPNMVAWMAARSDFPDYGQLIVYKLPKERLIRGPIQVEATIDQDTRISQLLSLWDQRGSRVIRGNLLIIPIDQSFVYVEPVYLIAEASGIPQLKRVIVSDGERIAMEPTLRESLLAVYGDNELDEPREVPRTSLQKQEAREALEAAEEAMKDGNWDLFGQSMQKLKRLLTE